LHSALQRMAFCIASSYVDIVQSSATTCRPLRLVGVIEIGADSGVAGRDGTRRVWVRVEPPHTRPRLLQSHPPPVPIPINGYNFFPHPFTCRRHRRRRWSGIRNRQQRRGARYGQWRWSGDGHQRRCHQPNRESCDAVVPFPSNSLDAAMSESVAPRNPKPIPPGGPSTPARAMANAFPRLSSEMTR
jgi:hypothetical protein